MADKAKKTETVKKAETTAKPRKAPVKKKKAELTPVATMVSREEIERLAHKYWAQRGYQHGNPELDWFRAEQELRQKAS
jgi:hypothetical protein